MVSALRNSLEELRIGAPSETISVAMATHAIPRAGQHPAPHGYWGRLWRLVIASVLTSAALLALRELFAPVVLVDALYEDQADVAGSAHAVVDGVWLVACGALIAAVLVRLWVPGGGGETRLRLQPLVAVFAVAIAFGSLGGPIGSSIGVGLLPLLVVAYVLPRLPHRCSARPTRPHVGLGLLVAAVLVATPPINAALASLEAGGVGCGSIPCRVGATGTTRDFSLGVRNRGRLPIVITDVTLTDLPARTRQLELRHSDSSGARGATVSLPLRLEPGGQLWVDRVVRVPPAACRRGPLASGAEVRYRVLGVTREAQLQPVGVWQRGLRCRSKR
jgi:hypothetical protein